MADNSKLHARGIASAAAPGGLQGVAPASSAPAVQPAAALPPATSQQAPKGLSAEDYLAAEFKEMGEFEGSGEAAALAFYILSKVKSGLGKAPGAGTGGGAHDLD